MRKALAFSLTELLVVLAILSVLAGFLFPTIENGIGIGRAAACATNLRQIGMATISYTEQNKGCIPYYSTRGKTEPDGYPAYFMLIKNGDLPAAISTVAGIKYWTSSLLLCPAALAPIPTWPGNTPDDCWETAFSRNNLSGTVAVNYPASPRGSTSANNHVGELRCTIFQYGVNGKDGGAGPFTCDLAFATNAVVPMTRIGRIISPASCWLAGDAYESILTKPVYRHGLQAEFISFDGHLDELATNEINYIYYGADFRVGDTRQSCAP